MLLRLITLAGVFFLSQQCTNEKKDVTEKVGKNEIVEDKNKEAEEKATEETKSGVASMSFVGGVTAEKEVGELFDIEVAIRDIDLQNIAAGYEDKLMLHRDITAEDLRVKLTLVQAGKNILDGNKSLEYMSVKNEMTKITDVYFESACEEGCWLVAELGSYGNRGCADDCEYPFVPIEPLTEVRAKVIVKPSSYDLQLYKLQLEKQKASSIKIVLTKNGKPAANVSAVITACIYEPPPSFGYMGSLDARTFCDTPNFAGYGGKEVIAKQTITLDADGSWHSPVKEDFRVEVCDMDFYMETKGRAFIKNFKEANGCQFSTR